MVSPTAREIRGRTLRRPRDGGRQDDPKAVEPRRAERERSVPQAVRHGPHRILAERSDVGDDHDAHHDPGAEDVEPGQTGDERLQQGRDEQQGEEAVHDRGHAAEELEGGLDHFRVRGEANSLR